jgi:hypothetical protein
MATIAWLTTNVPGSMAPTGNPGDTTTLRTSSGKCGRCERWPWEGSCAGVEADPVHLGS